MINTELSATEKIASAPFSSNLETDIKFDQRSGMYIALSRVMDLSVLSTLILNFTVPLPRILKVEFMLADNPEIFWFRGEYEIKKNLSAKQWSLAPESIKVRIVHLL